MEKHIESLVKRIMNIPCNSEEYLKVLEQIQNAERYMYGDQHILVIPREKINKVVPGEVMCVDISINSDDKLANIDHYFYSPLSDLFGHLKLDDLFCDQPIARFMPRYKVEYDVNYKQFMTFSYIRDTKTNNLVMLKKKEDEKVGFIGGHTDFGINVYSDHIINVIIQNLYKEVLEEIQISYSDNKTGQEMLISTYKDIENLFNVKIKWFINSNNNFYDLRNCGFIFELTTKNEEDFYRLKFETKEPEDHDVYVTNIVDLLQMTEEPTHSWIRYMEYLYNEINNKE